MPLSRRQFLSLSAAAATAAALEACSSSSKGGKGAGPSATTTTLVSSGPGKLTDIDHVVIFFQENRSFDHYFGTRKGVRGFGDTKVPIGENGKPNWYQPYPDHPDGYLLPWHLDDKTSAAQCVADPLHGWDDQRKAWNNGRMDGFAKTQGAQSLGYFEPADLPYYSALADNFTLCDAYHCSVIGPTNPNRLYIWTAFIDPEGKFEGPTMDNITKPWSWETYPERLQKAGISWRVYHQSDDFDDTSIKFFANYQNQKPGSPLYENALKNREVSEFAADVASGNLPQVSWIVAPTRLSEHPPFPPAAGEDLTHQYLSALMANPKVWAKTLFILSMDENGGFFDHVSPPAPPPGTPGEFINGQPIGLGARVPTIVASPWSRGGRVVSDVFDHTSTLQFLEKRFGVEVPYLTDWRRKTCGDLTSTLDFSKTYLQTPKLPATAARVDTIQSGCGSLPTAAPPAKQSLPKV